MSKARVWAAAVVGLLLVVGPVAAAAPGTGAATAPPVELQILAFNDFHGQIEPYSTSAGGAAYLATMLRDREATNPNTVIISGGDLIGASPLTSALFHDEPTIEVANLMGVDLAVVGNHEFDEGWQELLRIQDGGCHPVDGCLDGDGYAGADFPFLAANVVRTDTGETLFPPYKVMTFNGVRVAFIGVVLEATPTIVTASATQGLTFLDEADTINKYVKALKKRQIEAIVAVVHEGATATGCAGGIVDVVNRTDDEVDLFITGHTHNTYVCQIDGRTVTGTRNAGRVLTEIDLTLNKVTKEVTSLTAANFNVGPTVPAAADVAALVAEYQALAAPLANVVIGSITGDLTTATNAAGESALGDVIADAQMAYAPGTGGAVVAFMNPGGIRANILYAEISGGEAAGQVTYGEAFKVQPFANYLTAMTLTGAQIDALLEQQWDATGTRVLQVSNGFTYSYSAAAPLGSKVDPASIKIGGVTVDPSGTYRVTMNSFLADGGDRFTVFTLGTDRITGMIDLDALVLYFGANSPVAPGPQNRITRLP